jgi:hypothetical protein
MQKTFVAVLGATLIAATTVQMAVASEHHARKGATASEQFRNSNASSDIAAQSDRWSAYANGAQAAGIAGR